MVLSAINLSKLDFKGTPDKVCVSHRSAINLSKLDFKVFQKGVEQIWQKSINLSKLDFKVEYIDLTIGFVTL